MREITTSLRVLADALSEIAGLGPGRLQYDGLRRLPVQLRDGRWLAELVFVVRSPPAAEKPDPEPHP